MRPRSYSLTQMSISPVMTVTASKRTPTPSRTEAGGVIGRPADRGSPGASHAARSSVMSGGTRRGRSASMDVSRRRLGIPKMPPVGAIGPVSRAELLHPVTRWPIPSRPLPPTGSPSSPLDYRYVQPAGRDTTMRGQPTRRTLSDEADERGSRRLLPRLARWNSSQPLRAAGLAPRRPRAWCVQAGSGSATTMGRTYAVGALCGIVAT